MYNVCNTDHCTALLCTIKHVQIIITFSEFLLEYSLHVSNLQLMIISNLIRNEKLT